MTPAPGDTPSTPHLILETTLAKAETQRSNHHYEQARSLFEKAYEHARLMYGPTHPTLVEISGKIADAYRALGKHGKAADMQRAYVAGLSNYFGPNHSRTLEAAESLANDLLSRGPRSK